MTSRITAGGRIAALFLAVGTLQAETDKADPTYVLKPNDVVILSVFEEVDLSTQTRILQTGEAAFPLIGPVRIGGLSVRAATAHLRELYSADYLVDPKITLTLAEYAQQHVSPWVR